MDEVMKLVKPDGSAVGEDQSHYRLQRPAIDEVATIGDIPLKQLGGDEWNFGVGGLAKLMRKLHARPIKLGDVADIFVGLQTSADKIFVLPLDAVIEDKLCRPFLLTGDLTPYAAPMPSAKLLFPYRIEGNSAVLIAADELMASCPTAWSHLVQHRKALANRDNGKWNHAQWYAFGRSQNLSQMEEPKLIIQVTAKKPTVMMDESGLHMTGGGSGPFYGIRPKAGMISLRFLLGVMNSSLFGAIIRSQSTDLRGGYIKFSKQYIETAAFPSLDQAKSEDAAKHDRMVAQVDRMLELVPRHRAEKNPHTATRLAAEISAANRQIDELVYQLYGLTDEEIALEEGA